MLGHRHMSSNKSGWAPGLDEAVNKRFLSTGETGEFAGENVGFGLNPGVGRAVPQNLSSKWRERATRENVRNVGDEGGCRCFCQQNSRSELGQKRSGSAVDPAKYDPGVNDPSALEQGGSKKYDDSKVHQTGGKWG